MSDVLKTAAAVSGAIPGGQLVAVALGIADALGAGDWLTRNVLGSSGGAVAQQVLQAAAIATGGATDPEAVRGLPPEQQVALRVQLASIAAKAQADEEAARLDTLRAYLADVAGARAQTVALAQAGSYVQWAPPLMSLVVLVTFGVVMYAALTRALPSGSETILNMLLGTLAAMATSVVSYWVGSSAGSAQKTNILATTNATAAAKK